MLEQFVDVSDGRKTFYLSSIINAGLLHDLTLGVSHDKFDT